MEEFKNFRNLSVDNILPAYNWILSVIKSFNVDPEKFCPQFYKAFISTENLYKNIIGNWSLLFTFEVANHISAHLIRATNEEELLTFHIKETIIFSEKDLSLTSYLAGYVFETFYKRMRSCTKNTSLYSQQCLSFLLAGKCENVTVPEQKHVDIMDRGGLWKINENVASNFEISECYFRIATQKLKHC